MVGSCIAIFLLVSSLTGILLGWKKDVALLQPVTQQGISAELRNWKGFDEIAYSAELGMDSIGQSGNAIDRLDVRPDKGIVKVLFKDGYWEVQVDGASGKILSVAQRHSDWIEHVHDGSILNDFFKLIYTNLLGIGLATLSLSGLWLWYAPRIIRRFKQAPEKK